MQDGTNPCLPVGPSGMCDAKQKRSEISDLVRLQDLGFHDFAEAYCDPMTEKGDYRFFRSDLDRARSELTEDELTTEEYAEAVEILDRLFA